MAILRSRSEDAFQPLLNLETMRHHLFCHLLAAAAFFLFAHPLRAQFEAGTAIADITPEKWPLLLRGSFNPRPSSQVHDPLSARVLAVRNGSARAVIVLVDNVGVSRETLDSFKVAAAEKTGWKPSEMLIAATHSHSAPSLSGGEGPLGDYLNLARERVASGIQKAVDSLQPAMVGFASGEVDDEIWNRRWYLKEGTMPPNPFGEIDKVKMNPPRDLIVKPAGPVDPEVALIEIRTAKGKPYCALANYALHYVGAVPRDHVSADYFGEFCRLMKHRMRGADPSFLAILSNGTSGDINNIPFTETRPPRAPFEQIGIVASKVADCAWRASREIPHQDDAKVAILQREVTLRYRKPSLEAVTRAEKILAMTEEEQKKLPRLADHYAARTIRDSQRPDTFEAIIQAIRIGEQVIVTFPFEVLVEIGLEIKAKSPFQHTMIIELANGSYGYLPTPRQHELGGYETWPGTCRVQKDASVILTKNLLEMMTELHEMK